ncbi:MAG TPA: T9SS type A sorting domain-containing protein [Ignavibacteria bacterium]
MFKSTNGGVNWGYQYADTSIKIGRYYHIKFLNNKIGWTYALSTGIHTIKGGNDTTFFTSLNNNTTIINPRNFELKQNYPNPYNNSTLIEYYLNEQGWVKIKLYDITGKEIATLVNEVQSIGGYGIPVSIDFSSGIYFYRMLFIPKSGEVQADVKKLLIVK